MREFEELLNTWEHDGFKVEIYALGQATWSSCRRPTVGYRLYDEGKLIFEGDDFGPSPCHSIDGEANIMSLCGFLTCKPGDTDEEFFEHHTPEQFAWCQSDRAEELSLIVDDFENAKVEA